jgi:hypothetical protein
MKESSQSHEYQSHTKWCARAFPFTCAEWQYLKSSSVAYLHPAPISQPMSLGTKLLDIGPEFSISAQPMSVDKDPGFVRDVVAIDCGGA